MHRLAAQPGDLTPDNLALVEQPTAPVIFLTSATTDISTLAAALKLTKNQCWEGRIRALPLMALQHPAQIDHYIHKTANKTNVIIVRLLGSKGHWSYGFEKLQDWQMAKDDRHLISISGTADTALELHSIGSIDTSLAETFAELFRSGGKENMTTILSLINEIIRKNRIQISNIEVVNSPDPQLWDWKEEKGPKVGVILYKALYQSGDTNLAKMINKELRRKGLVPRTIWVTSLKARNIRNEVENLMSKESVKAIITSTSFSIAEFSNEEPTKNLWDKLDVPVFQMLTSSSERKVWLKNSVGLSPLDLTMQVVLPEIDGRITTRPCAFRTITESDKYLSTAIHKLKPEKVNIDWLTSHIKCWINLQEKDSSDTKICIILANYPIKNGRIANGVGLDTPTSTLEILNWLKESGHDLGKNKLPDNPIMLMKYILSKRTNDPESLNQEPLDYLSLKDYINWWNQLPIKTKNSMVKRWGLPGKAEDLEQNGFAIHGIKFGNITLLIQPSRGYDHESINDLHSPSLPPPHRYLAQYLWIKKNNRIDLIVHMGKHGSLEWLPGKGVGLSQTCYPHIAISYLPHIYPFIVNDPGEGSQAKRRSQAVIIDHMTPPLGSAGLHGDLIKIEGLMDEYYESKSYKDKRSLIIEEKIIELLVKNKWPGIKNFKSNTHNYNENIHLLLTDVESYLCEIKESQIRTGLHIFGKKPKHEVIIELILMISKSPTKNNIGITQWIAKELLLDLDPWITNEGEDSTENDAEIIFKLSNKKPYINGHIITWLDKQAALIIEHLLAIHSNTVNNDIEKELIPSLKEKIEHNNHPIHQYICNDLYPRLINSTQKEKENFLRGIQGKRIESGPSGSPTRGRPEVLPTGRNFYSVDLRGIPTESAWDLGRRSADNILDLYLMDNGEHLKKLALSVWATSTMRNGGEDICQLLALIGVKPVWDGPTRRVIDIEAIPLSILDRPRVDVFLRISGLFRDAFPNLIALVNDAQKLISSLDEPEEMNPLAAITRKQKPVGRVYGSAPGAYGAGLQALIDSGSWENREDLANAYISWSQWRYDDFDNAIKDKKGLEYCLKDIQIVVHNQDNREHDILDSDDYYQFQGGLAAAVEYNSGKMPEILIGDNSRRERPRVHKLTREIDKVMRSRMLNPRWIDGMKKHGYKGAFEMGASLDYLFAYDASTGLVPNWCYSEICEEWLSNKETIDFIKENNPWVLRDISERLLEAINRKMWGSSTKKQLELLKSLVIEAEKDIEHGNFKI